MFRFRALGGVSFVTLLTVPEVVLGQPRELPSVTVQVPGQPRPAAPIVAGNRSGTKQAKRASAKPTAPPAADKPLTNALGTYNPALDLPGLKLPPGTTLTTAGPVDGYRALSGFSATKTATPIEQIPQSIQVIPKSLITDQNNVTVSEAIQNVSNTQGTNTLAIGTTGPTGLINVRGFSAQQYLDGMNVMYNVGDRDSLVNVERIEVLKGPNAVLYGGGAGSPLGGAINIVSKLPTDKASLETGFTYGTKTFVQPYFDVNQPLSADKTVLFRFTGAYTANNTFVDVVHQDRYSLNPTLTLTNKEDTTLTIQGRLSRLEQQAYQGLPAVGTVAGSFRLNPDLYIGPSNIPKSYSEVKSVTATFDRKLDPIWSFNIKARWADQIFDQRSQTTQTAAPDVGPTTWSLLNVDLLQKQREFSINPNLEARFRLGPTNNVWLTGADYSRVTDRGHMNTDLGIPPVDLVNNPVFPTPYTDPTATSAAFFFPFFDYSSVYTTKGAYTQLQSTIYDRLHILAGVRFASINIDYLENFPFSTGVLSPTQFGTETSKVLPRFGAVLDLIPGLSVYGSYSEGMQASPFVQALNTNIEPETSKQVEGGFKFNVNDQLSGTIAVFDIQRQNVPVTIGVGIGAQSAQESKGYEADLIWQPTRSWKLIASYGHTDVRFSDSNTGVPQGNRVSGVPEDSGRVWVNYMFDSPALRGWSVGAGVYVASSQYVDNLNVYKAPGYFTVDAKIAYETEHWRASINVKNLTGEKYFVAFPWFGGQVAPGDGRAVYGTIAYRY
ncbi:TonB-dependent siderophore receptor [Bradyrhizobium sp. HKCCYLS20291]|uniref:TonB-dependent siderophore receptor n=1 Tax=Bradyrhizobium sp. HKCCYLS20291 TaxID=3420766 RepID=UPI003EB7EF97